MKIFSAALCVSLRISAFAAVNGRFNAEAAEIRREPQRAAEKTPCPSKPQPYLLR